MEESSNLPHGPGTRARNLKRRTETILDAATAILVEQGYPELSTRRIAARAGMRPGHLQYYFPTKQEVVGAILERYLERATRAVEARIAAAATTPGNCLEAALDGILADQRGEGCAFFRELWALASHDISVADAMRAFYRRYWSAIVAMALQTEPRLGRPRAERRAALIVALLEGMSLFRAPREPHDLPLPGLEHELRAAVRKLATDIS